MYKLNELSIKKDLNSVLEESYSLSQAESKVSFKKLYIESFGCQMNLSDSEIVVSILSKEGYKCVKNYLDAELILFTNISKISFKFSIRNLIYLCNKSVVFG